MSSRPWWVAAAQLTGVGWYVAIAIVAPTLGGRWIDQVAGTSPLFLLAGLAVGIVLAGYGTYRMLVAFLGVQGAPPGGNRP